MEDVCIKHGLKPSDYDLKHHNKILDLTTSIRFSNLPNKATVEIVEAEKKREEANVTIGLQLGDGKYHIKDSYVYFVLNIKQNLILFLIYMPCR